VTGSGYVDGLDLYQYVRSSPYSGTDPQGLDSQFAKCVRHYVKALAKASYEKLSESWRDCIKDVGPPKDRKSAKKFGNCLVKKLAGNLLDTAASIVCCTLKWGGRKMDPCTQDMGIQVNCQECCDRNCCEMVIKNPKTGWMGIKKRLEACYLCCPMDDGTPSCK
jgi:hypothetical protein